MRVCLVVLLLIGLVSCSGGAGKTAGGPMCAGTTPRSQVVVYSTTGLEYWYSDAFSTFQAECHVAISYFGAQSADVLARLRAEASAPLADLAVAFPPDITAAADAGLLAGAPGAGAVPADRCDATRRWCALAEDYTTWVYTPQLIGPVPSRWSDLLDPRFSQAIVTSGPDVPIGLAQVVLLSDEMGDAGAFSYLARLEANMLAHYTVTDTMSRVVASGAALVADGDLQEDLNDEVQYKFVTIWFPSIDGASPETVEIPYGAALVKGGHNPGNARALLAYLWSSAAQALVGEVYAAQAVPSVVQTDPRSAQVAAALGGVKIIRPDWEAVAAQAPQDLARWNALRVAPEGQAVPTTTIPVP